MKMITTATVITVYLTLICSCQQGLKRSSVDDKFEIDQGLVNYALPEQGTVVSVSDDNYDHPAETLTNGITSSENWDAGEGWAAHFDGPYEFAKYTSFGESAREAERLAEQMRQAVLDAGKVEKREWAAPRYMGDDDYRSSGLTRVIRESHIATAMGWVVLELPEERMITHLVIHTVDSEAYPAKEYGVKTLAVQYWALQGWTNVDRHNKRPGEQHNTVMNNKQGRIVVHFKPVLTSKIRIVIRYTNDTHVYGRGQRGGSPQHGYYRHIRGTIRLTEVEIYGPERQVGFKHPADADEQMIDEIFELESGEPVAPDPQAQIEDAIRAYASAYTRRDVSALMATISPDYSKDGENYQQLRDKMEGLFQSYTQVDFFLQRLRIQPSAGRATVEADYVIALTAGRGLPATRSGKLLFTLIESESGWQIARIDMQKQ